MTKVAAISGRERSAGVKSLTIFEPVQGGGWNNIGWGVLRWQEMVGTDSVMRSSLASSVSCAISRRKLRTSSTSFMLEASPASICPHCLRIVAA